MKKWINLLRSRLFWSLNIVLLFVLIFISVLQTNLEVSEKYLVKECSKKIVELSGENEVLKIASAQSASLDSVIALVQPLNFEKIDKIHYIKVLDNQVVVR